MIFVLSLACPTQFGNTWRKPDPVTNEDTASEAVENEYNTNEEESSVLDALWAQLDSQHCNDQLLGPGATGYFIGYYEKNEEDFWIGVEQQVLFGSPDQEVIEGGECQITWSTAASQGDVGECSFCSFSLSVTALLDMGQTDCPDVLGTSIDEWETVYDVLMTNGTSEFYFHNSGDFMASGDGGPERLTFVSSPTCYNF